MSAEIKSYREIARLRCISTGWDACILADAEIVALRAALAVSEQVVQYEQRHAAELETALAAATAPQPRHPVGAGDGNTYIVRGVTYDKDGRQALQLVTKPPEGILHHALRDQMARDAAEALKAIEEQQAKRERRLAEEQRREVDRRGSKCPCDPSGANSTQCPCPETGKPACA